MVAVTDNYLGIIGNHGMDNIKSGCSMKFNQYKAITFSSILLAILVIASELSESFKNTLKTLFSHHWVGKAIIISAVFIIVGFAYKNKNSIKDEKNAWRAAIASMIIIFLFFIILYFIE